MDLISKEKLIFNLLLHNDQFFYKSFPFLKEDYFKGASIVLFKTMKYHFDKYDKRPTFNAVEVYLSEHRGINEKLFDSTIEFLEELKTPVDVDIEWAIDQAEDFCQDKALYNALSKSVTIYDGQVEDVPKSAIPEILTDALAISFDNEIGLDYFKDAALRYDRLHKKYEKLPFLNPTMNDITQGGFERKTVNCILASCVTEDTVVRIKKTEDSNKYAHKDVPIKELKKMIEAGVDFKVDTPDGWQDAIAYVEKGIWEVYHLMTDRGDVVRCSEKHKFDTNYGWQTAGDMVDWVGVKVLCDDGEYHDCCVVRGGYKEKIVDISIDHQNHRYYTNRVSSKNTGVGKSAYMCHYSAEMATQGYNVLYITMEMAEEKIAHRIDANLFNKSMKDVEAMSKPEFLTQMNKIQQKGLGKIIVKEFPTASAHMGHIEALIRDLAIKQGFKPDIVCLDYLNICLSKRVSLNKGTYIYVKAITEEFRGLAGKYNFCGLTATQGNRGTIESSDIGLQDTGESKGVNDTLDFMLAMMSPEEYAKQGIMLCKQLKSRYDDVNRRKRFALTFDRSRMYFDEAETPEEFLTNKAITEREDKPLFDQSTEDRFLTEGDVAKNLLGEIKW